MSKLILIPGLGANRLLFEPQRRVFDQTLFLPDWPPPMWTQVEGKKPIAETLRDYGRRWADRWMQTVLSRPEAREAFWVGGVSLGGQVALEAARRLVEESCAPKGVFLIASMRSSASVALGLKVRSALVSMVPAGHTARLLARATSGMARKERLEEIDAHLLTKIAKEADPVHLRWGARACTTWTFTSADLKELQRAGVNIHQIHGELDWLVPLRRGEPDKVIHGGRHLINITHADEVNAYLRTRMASDLAAGDD